VIHVSCCIVEPIRCGKYWQCVCSASLVTSSWLHCASFCVDFPNQQSYKGYHPSYVHW